MHVYINGVLDDGTLQGTVPSSIFNTTGHAIIGREYEGTPTFNTFNGTIDDARIYSRALSATEIANVYAGALPTTSCGGDTTTGLIHYWKLDEAPGATTAADSAGATTLTKGGTGFDFTASGKFNNAATFPNNGQFKWVRKNPSPNDITGASALTISMWFKRGAAGAVLQTGQDSSGVDTLGIATGSDGKVYFDLSPTAGFAEGGTTAVTANDTNWHLATLVYDGTQAGNAARLKGYIDGVQQALTFTGSAVPATSTNNAQLYYIGGEGGSDVDYGTIDDVRIYSRALSAADVVALYAAGGGGGVCSNPAGREADLLYNNASSKMQYCNGSNWIGIGK